MNLMGMPADSASFDFDKAAIPAQLGECQVDYLALFESATTKDRLRRRRAQEHDLRPPPCGQLAQ